MVSSFLNPGPVAREHHLASLHLRRDASLPVILATKGNNAEDEGYAEGMVTNTRFGSFPHSTIIGQPWGSQIRASIVDTGSRGRKDQQGNAKKRKADALNGQGQDGQDGAVSQGQVAVKEPVFASSGFVHVLPPTPENWTTNLPHRTQVVYTPDYSYILHRLRARPGSRLIEAGSGSGSFTHAAARAVFNGYPSTVETSEGNGLDGNESTEVKHHGKVFSFEFHAERHEKVKAEMVQHGLEDIVEAAHRDVYKDGFLIHDTTNGTKTSPRASAVFLDLPAPWEAIPHLTRQPQDGAPSALDPSSPVHICTFSPCIEQVQKTISVLRKHDWLDIETVEVQHKRIDVRREYTGLQYEGMRGVTSIAANVEEAVSRLRAVERRANDFHKGTLEEGLSLKAIRQQHQQQDPSKLDFRGGRLIHRTEPELKTHTSYLTFAVLPRAWTEEDEVAAQEKWSKHVNISADVPKSQRQLKKEAKQRSKGQNGVKNGGAVQ